MKVETQQEIFFVSEIDYKRRDTSLAIRTTKEYCTGHQVMKEKVEFLFFSTKGRYTQIHGTNYGGSVGSVRYFHDVLLISFRIAMSSI